MRKSLFATTLIVTAASLLAMAATDAKFTPEQLKLPGKKGACMCLRDPASKRRGTWDENLPKMKKINPYWNYSWGAGLMPQQDKYITSEFVPMIWGVLSTEKLDKTLKEHVIPQVKKRKFKRILAFNEPDGKKQANMTVEQALKYWPQLEALGIPICSPSAVHPDKEWMTKFMAEAEKKKYRVDYIGVHSYGGTSATAFKKKMQSVHELYGRPLIITEFACADWNTGGDFKKNRHSSAKVLAFAKEVLPWMEKQDWIAGYAWFSFGMSSPQGYTSALYDDDGNLTALGKYYASVTTEKPEGDQSIEPDDAAQYLQKALAAAKHRETEEAEKKKNK